MSNNSTNETDQISDVSFILISMAGLILARVFLEVIEKCRLMNLERNLKHIKELAEKDKLSDMSVNDLRNVMRSLNLIIENDAPKETIIREIKLHFGIACKGNHTCSICCREHIRPYCLTPCGHTVCGVCAKNSQRCPFCRKRVRDRIPIYLDA